MLISWLKFIGFLKNEIKSGDVVLFKASNGMKFYELADRFIDMMK